MKTLFVFLLICDIASPALHFLSGVLSATSGLSEFPEFVSVGILDDVPLGYCDSDNIDIEPKTPWMKKLVEDDHSHHQWLNDKCKKNMFNFRDFIGNVMQRFNHSQGVHVFQRRTGCYLDDETGKLTGIVQFGYDGEDLISFDLETLTWVTPKHQTVITKHNWDRNGYKSWFWTNIFKDDCKQLFKLYLPSGKKLMQTPVPPSLFLLQKTPSSPVICHATGFYPQNALMFWRKNGEEIHEMDKGVILPNNDGTFQMSVELNVSSVAPEDWRHYDCVFQLSNLKNSITITLEKSTIRTNHVNNSWTRNFIAAVLIVIIIAAALGFAAYKMTKASDKTPL